MECTRDCIRAKILGLIISLKKDMERVCSEPKALDIIDMYKERMEEVLAAEASSELFGIG